MTSWLREIPTGSMLVDEKNRVVVIDRRVWDHIGAYNGSRPTGPSAGRVYRKQARTDRPRVNSGPGGGDRNYLFIVRDAPPEDTRGGQLHHPYEALIVEGDGDRGE